MNKFFAFAFMLVAYVSAGHCSSDPYHNGPAVQQISLSALPSNIDHYLSGVGSGHGHGHGHSHSYGAPSHSYAPASSVAVPSPSYSSSASHSASAAPAAPAYGAHAAPAYGAHAAPAYGAHAAPAYGAAKYSTQSLHATQLNPGQQNYRAYVSPAQRNRVSLPILPAEPVARLYVPQNSYAAPAHGY